MATVTDNSGKRRGRPRKWERDEYGTVKDYWEGAGDDVELRDRHLVYSRRQEQNIVLAFRARDRIEHAAEHAPEGSERQELGTDYQGGLADIPRTVLTELGRIEDDGAFWQAVFWYTEQKDGLRAHDAARMIRHMMIGKSEEGSTRKLAKELAKTVDDYRKRHPETTHAEADKALLLVRQALAQAPWPRP